MSESALKINSGRLSPEQYESTLNILSEYLQPDDSEKVAEKIRIVTRQTISEVLFDLLVRADMTPYEMENRTGIPRQSLEQALNKRRSISKPTVMAICMVFEMTPAEAIETLASCGLALTDAIEDRIFIVFLSRGLYRLRDYSDAVKRVYEALDVYERLPIFFNRTYKNTTLRLR